MVRKKSNVDGPKEKNNFEGIKKRFGIQKEAIIKEEKKRMISRQ